MIEYALSINKNSEENIITNSIAQNVVHHHK